MTRMVGANKSCLYKHTFTNIRNDVQVSSNTASALYIKWHKKKCNFFFLLIFVFPLSLAENLVYWSVGSAEWLNEWLHVQAV